MIINDNGGATEKFNQGIDIDSIFNDAYYYRYYAYYILKQYDEYCRDLEYLRELE